MIIIHCSSTIHQKSVPKDIINQVHDPHGSHMFALKNLESWRCCLTMSGSPISSVMKFLMWKSTLFLSSYIYPREMGHLNEHLTLGNLLGLTGSSLSRLPHLPRLHRPSRPPSQPPPSWPPPSRPLPTSRKGISLAIKDSWCLKFTLVCFNNS
jgi:hypothetical protein